MTLKIVSNNREKEVHSVRIEDEMISVIAIDDGSSITIKNMEKIFPDFKNIIENNSDTTQLLSALQQTNPDYIWAHVSGKL